MSFKLMAEQKYDDCLKQVKAEAVCVGDTILMDSTGATPATDGALTPSTCVGLCKVSADNTGGLIGAKMVSYTPIENGVWLEADTTDAPTEAQIGTVASLTDATKIDEDDAATTGEMGFAIKRIDATNKKAYGFFVSIP